jgi:polysaccharide biosynthesis protein PslH
MRVLYLTHRLPYAPNRGDRIRAYHTIRALAPRTELEVVSLVHDHHELAQTDRLRQLGVRVTAVHAPRIRNLANASLRLAGRQPLTHLLLDAPGLTAALHRIVDHRPPDVVLAYCSGMARFPLAPPLTAVPLVLDLVDVDSQKWAALSRSSRGPKRWIYRREASYLERFERLAVRRAHVTLVVNDRERDALNQIAAGADIRVVPNGVDLQPLSPPRDINKQPRIVFCGVMNYSPNIEAMQWFSSRVWPLIRARRPDVRFVIVGSDPAPAIQRLASERDGIEVTGTVADVRPYLWTSAVAVAPLLTARGVQNKVLEAIGAGLPAVVTARVFEGLPVCARRACRQANSDTTFAHETLSLLEMTDDARHEMVARADLHTLSWASQLRGLHGLLADAAGSVNPCILPRSLDELPKESFVSVSSD